MNPVDNLDKEEYEIPEGWDWKAYIPSWTWHSICFKKYEGWDIIEGAPPFVLTTFIRGDDEVESREMAVKFDDEAKGLFYYRDWTESSLPFVEDGEIYMSGFWFQKLSDARRFQDLNGGVGTWEPNFEEQRKAMKSALGKVVPRND